MKLTVVGLYFYLKLLLCAMPCNIIFKLISVVCRTTIFGLIQILLEVSAMWWNLMV